MPHQPWHVYPDGTEYDDPDPPGSHAPGKSWTLASREQQHLFQAQYADRLVGELMDRVKQAGIYEDSLIVVVADHGINFEPGEEQRLWDPDGADGIAYSPLLVKAPGQVDGAIDDQALMAYDVLPTVADALDIEVPWDTDGAPAGSDEITARGTTRVIYDFGPLDDPTPREEATFDDATSFPRAADRWIRSLGPEEPSLLGLMEVARAQRWLGASIDDLVTGVEGSATIDRLGEIEDPTAAKRPGFVGGSITGLPAGRVLVAVNGEVATAAPTVGTGTSMTFRAMLPPEAFALDEVEVRLAWIPGRAFGDDSAIVEVTIDR
jgi:hypothetical protein